MGSHQYDDQPLAAASTPAAIGLRLRRAPTALLRRGHRFLLGLDATLVRGSLAAFGLSIASMGLGFAIQVILARILGTEQYGLYLYTIGWANVAGLLCALELAVAGTRYFSAYAANGEWSLLRGFLRRSHQIVGGISIGAAVIGAIVAFVMRERSPAASACVLAASLLFPLMAVAQLHVGLLQGLKRVVHAQAPFQVLRPVLFGGGVLLVYVASSARSASATLLVQAAATAVVVTVTGILLRRDLPAASAGYRPVYRTGEWLRTSGDFIAISIAQLVLSAQADVLVVGTILGTVQAGLYGVANQFATLVGFGSAAIMFIAQPLIAGMYASGELPKLRRLSRQIVKLSLLVSIPIFATLLVFGHWLLAIYGRDFVGAYAVMVILSFSQLISASVGMLVGYLLTMTEHQRTASKIIGATAVLNLALTLLLTREFGMEGTATATAIATVVRSVLLLLAVQRLLGSRGDAQEVADDAR